MWDTLIINPMINTLLFIYSLIGNFGVAIILFTILIRLIIHPLMVQQIRGTTKMQEFQSSKEYKELAAKYKDDKQKLQQEQMKLYQEMGINPLGSCLPTLIQFPIIIGLYQAIIRVLAVAPPQLLDLSRHIYPFIKADQMLPVNNKFLWMDLSQPERLFLFGIGIPTLAVLVVITTFLQTKLMTPPTDPGAQGAQMTQAMNLYMPLLMGYLALTFASGLSLYFIASNVVTVAQYAVLGKVNWKNILPQNLLPKRSGPASGSKGAQKYESGPAKKELPSGSKKESGQGKKGKSASRKGNA